MKSALLTVLGVATALASTALADVPPAPTETPAPAVPVDATAPASAPAPDPYLGSASSTPAPAGDAVAQAPASGPLPPDSSKSPYTTTTAMPAASTAGFIVGIDGGAFWLQDFTVSSGPIGLNFKFKTGFGIDVPLGYDFGNGFSLFLDVGYDRSDFQQLTGHYDGYSQNAATGGSLSFVPVMANAAYSFNLTANFHWYLGVGVGAVYSRASFSGFDVPATRTINFGQLGESATIGGISDSTWSFGFQAFSGFAFDFSPNASVHVGYKYLRINDSVSVNGSSNSGFNSSLVELGFTFKF